MALDEWDEALHLSIEGRPDRARQRIGRLE
jgi:hypothetical protein